MITAINFISFAEPDNMAVKADQQYKFSQFLFSQHDYFRAITELKRFTFLYPDDPHVSNANFLIAESYYKAGKWNDALNLFQTIETVSTGRKHNIATLRLSHCLIELKLSTQALEKLSHLIVVSPDVDRDINVNALLLSTLAAVRLTDIDKTKDYLNRLNEYKDNAVATTFATSALSSIQSYSSASKKSPFWASIFSSVIPGTGQIYAGRKTDGYVAATSIALFTVLAIDANSSKHRGERNFLYFFNASQYIANIYGANKAAKAYNTNKKIDMFNQLNGNIIGTINNQPISGEIP